MSDVERRVLLLAPRGRDAQVIATVLEPAGLECRATETMDEFAAALAEGAGIGFVTEEALLGWPHQGLVEWLGGQPPWSDFPFIVLATRRVGSRPLSALRTLEALGNVVILERPLNAETLLSAASAGLRARQRQYQTREHLLEQARVGVETQRLLEAEIHARRQMHEAREMLALALDAAELGTFHLPLPIGPIRWNATALAQFFFAPDEQPDMNRFYQVLHPEDRDRVATAVGAAVDEGQPYDIEYRVVSPRGEVRWVRAKGRAFNQTADAPARFDGVTIDISRQKALEREREVLLEAERAARIHAEDASRMKDEFLANLSHELRTPLGAILGWTHVLGKGQLAPDQQRAVETIARNARSQAKLIEDLLDMTRIISGNIRLDLEAVRLPPLIDATVASLQPVAATRGVRLLTSVEVDSEAVSGDPHRLQQVIWNLLSNAIKFTSENGEVRVLLRREADSLRLSVTDTGVGIAGEFLPYVFDRFRQADASSTRGHGGLGLGLAIVKTLVELHGGRVEAASPGLGQGAAFSVVLPLLPPVPAAVPDHGSLAAPSRRYGVDLCGIRVMVVDDEADLRDLVEEVLRECGADVEAAASGGEALQRLPAFQPHVLITDIAMPQMDGYELLRQVRLLDDETGGGVRAIALTAFAHRDDRQRALLAGFLVHVSKPVEPTQLIATVAAAAGRD